MPFMLLQKICKMETTNMILSIAGSVILILLGLIGYFLNRFATSLDELVITVRSIDKRIVVHDETIMHDKEQLIMTRETVRQHDKRITKMEHIIDRCPSCRNAGQSIIQT